VILHMMGGLGVRGILYQSRLSGWQGRRYDTGH